MPKYIDLTGQKFGRWKVIEKVPNLKSRDSKWLCQCDCGQTKEVLGKNLRNGRSSSCGCYKNEISRQEMIKRNKKGALDLRNDKYGLLTPIEPTEKRSSQGSVIWKCLCDCGNYTEVSVDNLRGEHPVRSCGCISYSIGEKNIENILINYNINYQKEYKIKELGQYRYDFAIFEENKLIKLIEFDGRQHYEKTGTLWDYDFEERQKRDQIKNEYALSHNIPLVRIPYWERDNITLEMIMGDKYLVKPNG